MIVNCPSCNTRFLVRMGLFAEGPRRVRCGRCRHEWRAEAPGSAEVLAGMTSVATPIPTEERGEPAQTEGSVFPDAVENLTNETAWGLFLEIVGKVNKKALVSGVLVFLVFGFSLVSLIQWRSVIKKHPALAGYYEILGLSEHPEWEGLVFQEVKSELKFDGGGLKLFVDGEIQNNASKTKTLPDIKAHALGVDKSVIQSWWIEAPVATIEAGKKAAFHTNVVVALDRTIADVSLEFLPKKEEQKKE